MTNFHRSLSIAAAGALLLGAPCAAFAQQGNTIGNPQLRDFQLPGERRVAAPPPAPVVVVPPPPTTTATQPRPQTATPPREAEARPAQPTPRQQAPAEAQPAAPPAAAPTFAPIPEPVAPVAETAPQPAPTAEPATGGFPWLYAIPVAAIALLGLVFLLRRRRREEDEPEAEIVEQRPAAVTTTARPAPAPAPEPIRRPWLELTLKVERASANLDETIVQFELEIANTGEAAARNLRLDVKMFNAGAEQDKEIGAFFGTAGRESTKLNLPGLAAGASGIIRGEVAMKRDDMRAVVLEEKYLFIPMLAVNALYDWGEGQMGQTSKSYVVGRELEQPSAKMGAFRVDQGPRVWRTIGQRQHTLERRV